MIGNTCVHSKSLNQIPLEGEFVPYFQPVIDLRLGCLAGFELLARLHHPTDGIVGPDAFILAAEEEGWIGELTIHLLEKALPAFASLPGEPFLAFNISPLQFHDLELPNRILDLALSMGFPMERLSVEITETALFPDLSRARKVAERFRFLGCSLGLDDFGTGYSSLKTLQALPFNVLKVDRSFVSTMTTSRESRKIVAAVIGLGQSLGLTTVAEGSKRRVRTRWWIGWAAIWGKAGFTGGRFRPRLSWTPFASLV